MRADTSYQEEININMNEEQTIPLQDMKEEEQQRTKQSQGICLLFLSAFLFSFMGMFLQFTGRMGE